MKNAKTGTKFGSNDRVGQKGKFDLIDRKPIPSFLLNTN